MFTALLIFMSFLLLPFILAPTVGFHSIKERYRYNVIKNVPASEGEAFALKICMGILTFLLVTGDYLAVGVIGFLGSTFVIILSLLAVYYLLKIGRSIISGSTVKMLGFSLETKGRKLVIISLIILVFLTELEIYHVLPTYSLMNQLTKVFIPT